MLDSVTIIPDVDMCLIFPERPELASNSPGNLVCDDCLLELCSIPSDRLRIVYYQTPGPFDTVVMGCDLIVLPDDVISQWRLLLLVNVVKQLNFCFSA